MTLALSMLLWPTALAKEGTLTGKGSPSDHSTSAIKARGVLTIASNSQSAIDYLIPNDPEKYGDLAGTRGGAVPEVARQIAKELGVKAVFVEYDTVEEALRATASGEVDVAAGAFLLNDEREALYQMTDSYDIAGEEVHPVYLSTKPQSGSIPKNERSLAAPALAWSRARVRRDSPASSIPRPRWCSFPTTRQFWTPLSTGTWMPAYSPPVTRYLWIWL